jgi:hypothetical protein
LSSSVIFVPRDNTMERQIQFIIDIDGFKVAGRSYAYKEFGVANLLKKECWVYRFKTGIKFNELSEKDIRTVRYVSKFIHGLSLCDYSEDLEPESLPQLLNIIAEECIRNNTTIAYKGGHLERDALKGIIDSSFVINLEELGCPKFETLYYDEEIQYRAGLFYTSVTNSEAEKCDRHRGPKSPYHCPLIEVPTVFCSMVYAIFAFRIRHILKFSPDLRGTC